MKNELQLTVPYEDELLTVYEVAYVLRVDETTVRRWVTQGILSAVVLPHKGKRQSYRIKRSALQAVLRGGQAQ